MSHREVPQVTAEIGDLRAAELAVLRDEHARRFLDKLVYTDMYASQITYLNVFTSVVIGMAAILGSIGDVASNPRDLAAGGVIGLLLAGVIMFYLLATLMDALFHLYANEHRLAALETEINARFGKKLLIWDSEVMPRLHPTNRLFLTKRLISPSYFLAFWSVLLALALGIALVALWELTVGRMTYAYGAFLGFGLLLVGHQWVTLHTAGGSFLKRATADTQD